MKKFVLVALCLYMSTSLFTIPVTTAAAVDYQSRYTLPSLTATETITLNFTFLSATGANPADFTLQIFRADGTTSAYGPVTVTVSGAGTSHIDTSFTVVNGENHFLELRTASTVSSLVILQIDVSGSTTGVILEDKVDVIRNDHLVKLIHLEADGSITAVHPSDPTLF